MDWVTLLLKIAPVALTGALGVVAIGRETFDPATKKLTRFGVTTRIAIVLMTLLAVTSQVLDDLAVRRSAAAVESRMQTQERLQLRTLDTITEAASSTPASLQVDLSFESTPSVRTGHSSRLLHSLAAETTSMRRLMPRPNAASRVASSSISLSGFLKHRRKVELHAYPEPFLFSRRRDQSSEFS